MIIVMGTLRVQPAAMSRLGAAMRAVIEATRAEDGCIEYAYGEDVLDPGLIRVSEKWRDRDALKAHFRTPHMARWKAEREAAGELGRDIMIFEANEGEAV